jgi:hypothetical protein
MQKLPQLTLRDLFWLVALVAMGCGWWVERIGKSSVLSRLPRTRPANSNPQGIGLHTADTMVKELPHSRSMIKCVEYSPKVPA